MKDDVKKIEDQMPDSRDGLARKICNVYKKLAFLSVSMNILLGSEWTNLTPSDVLQTLMFLPKLVPNNESTLKTDKLQLCI